MQDAPEGPQGQSQCGRATCRTVQHWSPLIPPSLNHTSPRQTQTAGAEHAQNPAKCHEEWGHLTAASCSSPPHRSAPRHPPHKAAPLKQLFPKHSITLHSEQALYQWAQSETGHAASAISSPTEPPLPPPASRTACGIASPFPAWSGLWLAALLPGAQRASRAVAPGSRRREAAHFQSHYGLKRVPSGILPVQHIYFPKPQRGFVILGSILVRAACRWCPAGSSLPGHAECCRGETLPASPGQRVVSPRQPPTCPAIALPPEQSRLA